MTVKSRRRQEIPWTSHHLSRLEDRRYYCPICGKSWVQAPRTLCPGVIVYPYGGAPEHLKTERQLKQLDLKLAPNQQPAGVIMGQSRYFLYDQGHAIPRPPRTPAQIAAFKKARAAAFDARTCSGCGIMFGSKRDLHKGLCEECLLEEEIKNAKIEAIAWACQVLADPQTVILDTETTGLDGQIIEIAIIDITGQPLLNTLVKPCLTEQDSLFSQNALKHPSDTPIIPSEATAVHGISDADVADAPTFAEIYEQVGEILRNASRIVIYNAAFDQRMLRNSCQIFHLPSFDVKDSKFECAMKAYAEYYGEWSYYYEDFKWQPLAGGHRALEDCLACLGCIQWMAESGQAEPSDKVEQLQNDLQ